MAYRELLMVEIREILRRLQAHHSQRQITRETGLDRKTVRRYSEAAHKLGVTSESELSDELVRLVTEAVQARPVNAMSPERQRLVPIKEEIRKWLEDEELKLTKIHDLVQRRGIEITYATLRRFAIDEFGFGLRKPTVRLADPAPGQEAQTDFGQMGLMLDPVTGRRRRLWALLVTLSCSRYTFVFPTFEQTLDAVCEGLDAAWRFFGGAPRCLVVDNLKPVITKANSIAPVVNASFLEYAQSRGLFVDAARVRHPKDKARVENQVPYVRESWFQGERFVDIEDARRSAEAWCRDIAGERIHGTTRRMPKASFEEVEQSQLQAAPVEQFDIPTWTTAKVHPDHHVNVARALYSVPTRFIGKKLRVRLDQKMVRLYLGAEMVKVHGRVGPGERSTDAADYPDDKAAYAFRDTDRFLTQASKRGEAIRRLADRLLSNPMPWRHMRQVQSLLRIADKYGAERVNEACNRALAFDVTDVRRIERLVKLAKSSEDLAESRGQLIPMPARFARDTETFRTTRTEDEEGTS